MKIIKIDIENFQGISNLIIEKNILKNRPNILVAPNGFGKTSIAKAFFSAASQTSINTNDENRHEHDVNNKSKICIELQIGEEVKSFSATEVAHSNEIRKNFDIHVVSDPRKLKATSKNFGGFSKADAKMIIEPIVICDKPKNAANPCKIREIKKDFGNHSSLLPQLEDVLFSSPNFIMRSSEILPLLGGLSKNRKWAKVDSIRGKISSFQGNKSDALSNSYSEIEDLCQILPEFSSAINLVINATMLEKKDAFLVLWMMLSVAKNKYAELKGYLDWLRYSFIKSTLQNALSDLNTSWKSPILKETKGKLIVQLPSPSHISNGQRDVLFLLSMLYIAKYNLKKTNAILIVDEVFDYLDDANLTVAQYYISQIIKDYKEQGRIIFPIILTHLNPKFFKNYVFSNQNVIYLAQDAGFDSIQAMKDLIAARDNVAFDENLRKNISKYLVHYHCEKYDFSAELRNIPNTRSSWGKTGRFDQFLLEEFEKYKNNLEYDPLAICALTRRTIEKLAYSQVKGVADIMRFFETHKTGPKLDWAAQRGAKIPEMHYLLRLIYDEGMHWKPNRDNTVPIIAKLTNPVIKSMITEIISTHIDLES